MCSRNERLKSSFVWSVIQKGVGHQKNINKCWFLSQELDSAYMRKMEFEVRVEILKQELEFLRCLYEAVSTFLGSGAQTPFGSCRKILLSRTWCAGWCCRWNHPWFNNVVGFFNLSFIGAGRDMGKLKLGMEQQDLREAGIFQRVTGQKVQFQSSWQDPNCLSELWKPKNLVFLAGAVPAANSSWQHQCHSVHGQRQGSEHGRHHWRSPAGVWENCSERQRWSQCHVPRQGE